MSQTLMARVSGCPTRVGPNAIDCGLTESTAPLKPLPVRVVVCGEEGSLSDTTRFAVSALIVGTKVTLTVQFPWDRGTWGTWWRR